ncbi:MAG: hypothetical protein P3W94_006310 [Paracoccus sp. (in: a-proteobacteria)]|nr:hypothetical protein [Paracoccus sp. (in: a-proteobacteria)]
MQTVLARVRNLSARAIQGCRFRFCRACHEMPAMIYATNKSGYVTLDRPITQRQRRGCLRALSQGARQHGVNGLSKCPPYRNSGVQRGF